LAQQVEQGKIDPGALEPSLNAERTAAVAQSAVDKDTLNRLHALLTPAQRGQIVDALEATRDAARAGKRRGGPFDGAGKLGLSPEQRSEIRANLRADHGGSGGRSQASGAPHGSKRAALETFRGDAFDPASLVHVDVRGERAEKFTQAMVPVLSAEQRATFANELRSRSAR
jgi:hypothetical protein